MTAADEPFGCMSPQADPLQYPVNQRPGEPAAM
jgi:hypothetical protein